LNIIVFLRSFLNLKNLGKQKKEEDVARIKLLGLFDGPKEKKVFGFIEFLEENISRLFPL